MRKYIGLDIETHLIERDESPKGICCSLYSEENGSELFLLDDHGYSRIHGLLEDPSIHLILTNAAFDMISIAVYGEMVQEIFWAYNMGRIHCTHINQAMINMADPAMMGVQFKSDASLAGQVLLYLGEDISSSKKGEDTWRLRYGELEGIPIESWPNEAKRYAKKDAEYSYKVFFKQLDRVTKLPNRPLILSNATFQTMASFCLNFCSSAIGVKISERVHTLKEETLQKFQNMAEHSPFYKVSKKSKTGYSCNKKQIGEYIKKICPNYKKTQTGKVATSSEAIEFAQKHLNLRDRSLDAYLEAEDVRSIYSKYLTKLEEGLSSHRRRKKYSYSLGKTGRGLSTVFNNLPREGEIRGLIVPEEGRTFLFGDYSNAEMRSLAHISHLRGYPEQKLWERYSKDPHFDPHTLVACGLYNGNKSLTPIEYEEGLSIIKDESHIFHKTLKNLRRLAKVLNFGLAGGLGSGSLVGYAKNNYGVELSRREAEIRIREWKRILPEMNFYFYDAQVPRGTNGKMIITPITGRCMWARGFTQACNYPFQSISSDGAKDAFIGIFKECFINKESVLYGSLPIIFLHDEIVLEIKKGNEKEKGELFSKIMCQSMEKYTGQIKAILEWEIADRWTK